MTALTTATSLFDALTQEGVRYCHFKSNEHVAAGLTGLTDLDLLCDGRQVGLIEEVLASHGFKRFPAHSSRRYIGVEDFFAADETTGRLLHLHVHYRLIVGQRFFKNYRLPWEQQFLDARIDDESAGIFVADPALEWLLLACRAALKIRWRDRIRARAMPQHGEHGDMLSEHSWLAGRVNPGTPAEHASRLLGDRAGELVGLALADSLHPRRLADLRRELLGNPKVLRVYQPIPALGIRWSRELTWIVGSINRRYLHRPFPYRRAGSAGGIMIAVIGSDGAGKSSITQLLDSWLAGKVDVITIYFGSGQGRSSILRLPLKLALQLVRARSGTTSLDPEARRTRDVSLSRAIWALALAREKRAKLRMAMRARERGFIVICDRYPQTQVDGVNDGPLLWRWMTSGARLKRTLAQWEAGIYEMATSVSPDVVIRLLVTPETAAARRPDDDPRELEFRTQLVRNLRFDTARYGVIDIEAEDNLDDVVLEVKRQLWPAL